MSAVQRLVGVEYSCIFCSISRFQGIGGVADSGRILGNMEVIVG